MRGSQETVVVVGAGPAGVAAAVQCIRQGLDVLVVERERVGGLIYYARKVENFPGFVGLRGHEVCRRLEGMLRDAGVRVIRDEVSCVIPSEGGFTVCLSSGEIGACAVILATGARPRSLGIPGEVHYPPWVDYSGKRVAVIGGGDVAFDYALRISELGGEVTLLHRSDPRAIPPLRREAREAGIRMVRGEVERWATRHEGLLLYAGGVEIPCDLPVVAIGREPHLPEIRGTLGVISSENGKTQIPGLYVVGEASDLRYRQMGIAVGMGLAAAMDCARWVRRDEGRI